MKTELFELGNGGLLIGEDNYAASDYALADSPLAERLENVTPDTPTYEYNQAAQRRTRNGCTNYMAIKMLSDLFQYEFSLEEILEIHDLAEKEYWWEESRGNWLHKAIDCARNWWNTKYPDRQVVSYSFPIVSRIGRKVLESGKTVGVGYLTSIDYYNDSQDDGEIDKSSFASSKKGGGHAVSYNGGDIIDNYVGRKRFNKYENKHLMKLSQEGTFFRNWYVFFKKNEVMEHINIPAAKVAYKLGLWNGQNAKDPMSREEVVTSILATIKKIASWELTIKDIERIERELGV